MEQRRRGNVMAQRAHKELADARAMELEAKHPQLENDNGVEDRSPEALHGNGGGEAGLARIVGHGKRRGRKPKACAEGGTNGYMEGNGKLEVIHHDNGSDDEMHGGARTQGKMLGEHLVKLHGAGFFDDFAKGFMSVIKPVAGLASFLPGPYGMAGKIASGVLGGLGGAKKSRGRPRKTAADILGVGMRGGTNQIAHAGMEDVGLPGSARGGQDLLPGAVAPRAYGNVPQAPASFQRNTVGMGQKHDSHGAGIISGLNIPIISGLAGMFGLGKEKKKRAPSARNQAIAKLMREKGMSLGQASSYLKQHGSA